MALEGKRSLPPSAYTVALICPLEVEMSAARFMLDEEHARLPPAPHDTNQYVLGHLSGHNVVIASLPEGSQGTASAAAVAVHIARTFPSISLRLLVGIGGGIPSDTVDIRLGDVAVSTPSGNQSGVVEYDLGKQTPDGFVRKGFLCPPAVEWMTVIPHMKSNHRFRSNMVSTYLSQMMQRSDRLSAYRKPSHNKDILFQADYKHESGKRSCNECDIQRTIHRPVRVHENEPVVHYGLIASGNQVMKDGIQRERISNDLGGAICFEMEAAGLMNDFSCIVIRGISDYADSHKNDEWQPYAAATAAGVAKEILSYMNATLPLPEFVEANVHFSIPRKVNSAFTGRKALLEEIKAALHPRDTKTSTDLSDSPPIYVITGMGGIGKSELCLKLATMMKNSFWGVFWVDVSDMLNATRDFCMICQKLNLQESGILGALSGLTNLKKPWLLILDNADDPEQDINSFIPPGGLGSILVTSRITEAGIHATVGSTWLEGLPADEALALFSRSSDLSIDEMSEDDDARLRELVLKLLGRHTLALIQAGAYIRLGYSTLHSYLDLFRQSAQDEEVKSRQIRALQYRSAQEKSRYQSVYYTFEISLSYLEDSTNPETSDALCLLNTLAILSHTSFPTRFFRYAWETYRDDRRNKDYLKTSDTSIWEHLSQWHRNHLPAFLSPLSSSWDRFRLQEAINKLHNLALLHRTMTDGSEVVSMHPLIHLWARLRQQEDTHNTSWIQAGSLIAHSWRDDDPYDPLESQIIAHLQEFLDQEILKKFALGPEAEICVIFLRCAFYLWRQGLFNQMREIISTVFSHLTESSRHPTKRLIHFHLLDAEFSAVRNKSRETVANLQRLMILMMDRAPDDNLLLRTKVKLAHAMYDVLDRQSIVVMEEVVKLARQSQQRWDRDLVVWQVNLAGLYGDDRRDSWAIRVLEGLTTIERRLTHQSLATLGSIQGRKIDDIELIKQILRSIIIKRRWGGAKICLPLEDRLPELKYRSQVWSGRLTHETEAEDDKKRSLRSGSGLHPSVYQAVTTRSTPKFHLLLRSGSFTEAIQHLRKLSNQPSARLQESVWLPPNKQQLLEVSGLIQSASEEAANQEFLENFKYPDRGVDMELDQLRAQQKALEFPGKEIAALERIDRAKAREHPYFKLSTEDRSRYVMEGRWDAFECPVELKRLIEDGRRELLASSTGLRMTPGLGVKCVDIRRQLRGLTEPPPPWWFG